MTWDDIEAIDKEFLTPTDVAPYLHMTPHYIRIVAKKNPEKLLFPVIVSGNRTKIPKTLFVKRLEGMQQNNKNLSFFSCKTDC